MVLELGGVEMQRTIDNSSHHRIQFMQALKNGVMCGDLSEGKARELRRSYDNHGRE